VYLPVDNVTCRLVVPSCLDDAVACCLKSVFSDMSHFDHFLLKMDACGVPRARAARGNHQALPATSRHTWGTLATGSIMPYAIASCGQLVLSFLGLKTRFSDAHIPVQLGTAWACCQCCRTSPKRRAVVATCDVNILQNFCSLNRSYLPVPLVGPESDCTSF
jgi:hypothetical protein